MSYHETLHFLQTKGQNFERVRMRFVRDKMLRNSQFGKFGSPFDKLISNLIKEKIMSRQNYTPEPLPRHRSGIYTFMLQALRRVAGWL